MAHTAKIADIAGHVPERLLDYEKLAALYPAWPAEKIVEKTGIHTRHIADVDETTADLAYTAARKLFARRKISASDVDSVILCTRAPDYTLRTTACVLQYSLGIPTSAGALDVNLGCSGFVYSLSLAKGLVETGSARCVLVLTANTYSKVIHPRDKSVRTLFGDGAAATAVVTTGDPVPAIGPFVFDTDGSGAHHLIVPAGGFRAPRSADTAQEEASDASKQRPFRRSPLHRGGQRYGFHTALGPRRRGVDRLFPRVAPQHLAAALPALTGIRTR